MKKILTTALTVALSVATNTAAAENIGAFCRNIHDVSELIMLERQNHESMPDMIAAAAQISDDKATIAIVSIIVQAFDKPAYLTTENKIKASRKFANEQYLRCIRRQ